MFGCGDIAHALTRAGLIDEFGMWVQPVVWGSGRRLFSDASEPTALDLMDTPTLGSGVVVLNHRPAAGE